MKKLISLSMVILTVVTISFYFKEHKEEINNKNLKLADARLSMAKIEKDIESRINYILEDINTKHKIPTIKELNDLVKSIEVVRAYGKDISEETKINLLKIVKKLTDNNFKDKKVLKDIEDIATTSQQLTA